MFVKDEARVDLGGNRRHGDIACFTPQLWKYLVDRFAVRSLLDVGCGEGFAVAYFRSLGVHAHGIEGLKKNVERAVIPVALHDLTRGPYFMPVDLVLCFEVVEHIETRFLSNLMDTLCNGRVVVMTHAVPGQGGHHHVNEQPAEYWIEQFSRRGYTISREVSLLRDLAKREGYFNFFLQSGLVFLRD